MLCYILMTVMGAGLVVYGVKKSKIILVAGALLAAGGLFLVICTAILAYSVSHSEPNPKFDPGEIITGDIEVGNEDDGSEGSDWRSWRSYSPDYAIGNDVTVCLSCFDDGSGFAVYDSVNGKRVGSIVTGSGEAQTVSADTEIKSEDIDGDGLNELGIVISESDTVWFHYTDAAWVEGAGGGCFTKIEK